MERDVLRHSPQLVIIMFGLNDARSQSPATYRKNLGTMVRRVRDAGAEAMLMSPNAVGPDDPLRPPRIVAEYAQIMRDVGRDLAVPVVDAYATFAVLQGADPATWRRLMSDTIHPNMRGHRIFAEETAQAISGRFVSLAELPALKPGLPFVLARLRAHQPVRVLAMAPCDTLIAPALRARFPDAVVEVTAWQPDPDSITAIEAQARERGWEKFRHDKEAVRPDLVLVAVPSTARAATDEQFRHSYYWTLNWSLSSGMKPGPEWDCLVVLPSVTGEKWDAGTQAAEERALDIVRGQDIPWVARDPADRRTAVDLLSAALGPLL
ncbi:MAG: lysophospholipase L1-like esterase, partial [Verrucomicrobia bacterium]|nr:lysophospholipase L1-like esterase [Verrucomicrobiota bacterium]